MPLRSSSCDDGVVTLSWSVASPPDFVWMAWADPVLVARWLGDVVECDLTSGGRLVVDHGEGFLSHSVILESSPPHRLLMTWEFPNEAPSQVSVTVEPTADGSLLTLVHDRLADLDRSYETGWMTHLTFLEAAVAGEPIPASQFWTLHATFQTLIAADYGSR